MVIIAVTLAVILGASSMVVESGNQYHLYTQKTYFWINDQNKMTLKIIKAVDGESFETLGALSRIGSISTSGSEIST